jgi:hypothetical protein
LSIFKPEGELLLTMEEKMGYTHYWTQLRDFSPDEWKTASGDISAILAYAQDKAGIALAGWDGTGLPTVEDGAIRFNGCVPNDDHETMQINREITKRGPRWEGENPAWNYCKTAYKPYDTVVTACLCYLATVAKSHSVSSHGDAKDFESGLELARHALPQCDTLDIPEGIKARA